MDQWYYSSKDQVCRQLGLGSGGLSESEAARRLGEQGENALWERPPKKPWQVFAEQFQDFLVVILLAAAFLSALSGDVESMGVIAAVLVLNAVLGTVQYEKARKSLAGLKALSAPCAHVIRDGRRMEIPARQVVVGDLVVLETGGMVPADGRLLECSGLQMNESSLTGESVSRVKISEALSGTGAVAVGDQRNMAFSGTRITGGRGKMAVTATGMNTEIGKIAALMNETEEKETPLQVSLDRFGGRLAVMILAICALVFALSLWRKTPVLESLMFAVALAVAAIPEALGSIVTIVQAMGTQRMAKEHAIIKDLKAVEGLGCVSVICSDKTGTLTQNRMSVQSVYADGRELTSREMRLDHPVCRLFIYGSMLDNDARPDGAGGFQGDPMEAALGALGEEAGADWEALRRQMPRQWELPFDSRRKRMSTVHLVEGQQILFTKGAPDVVMERCSGILTLGGIRPFSGFWRQRAEEKNEMWAAQGLRVLALAFRPLRLEELVTKKGMERGGGLEEEAEQELTFLGLAAMVDPPRAESRPAVLHAARAGIRTVMITGDYRTTALAIGKRIGLVGEEDQAVTGSQLDGMDEEELSHRLEEISVFARVSPEHKLRIVDAWQKKGHVVAMTGDGVNDAPALKKADIGIAMGLAGTDVSRDAASMILMDDNFATIMKAVANGRNVYRNIRNAIQFLLSGNMAGILCVLAATLAALPMPFAPVHLLFINLLTDSLPAIAIGMEPQEEGLLNQPPRNPSEGILTPELTLGILLQGSLIAAGTMAAYCVGLATGNGGTASTMAFASLTLARLLHGFNCRSRHSIFYLGLRTNPWSVMAFGAGTALLGAVLFFPGLQVLFSAADLTKGQLMATAVLALLPTVAIQGAKTLREAFL